MTVWNGDDMAPVRSFQARAALAGAASLRCRPGAFNRMFCENSVKDLRAMEKARDREASAWIMRPLMLACCQSELKKAK